MLRLWEMQQYVRESYGDAGYVGIYGMPPSQLYWNSRHMPAARAVGFERARAGRRVPCPGTRIYDLNAPG